MEFSTLLLAAGSATASDVALKGGMSLIDGTFITAVFTGMAAVISAIGTLLYCNRRSAKKEDDLRTHIANELRTKIVNDPVNVKHQPAYVTCDECAAHRSAISKRIDELGPALERIFKKLSDNDKRSEERANQMHRRVDPLIEKLAATSAEVEMMKHQSVK